MPERNYGQRYFGIEGGRFVDSDKVLPPERGSLRFSWKNLLFVTGGILVGAGVGVLIPTLIGELIMGVPPLTTLTGDMVSQPVPIELTVVRMLTGVVGMMVGADVTGNALRPPRII